MTHQGGLRRNSSTRSRWLLHVGVLALLCSAGCELRAIDRTQGAQVGRYEPAQPPDGGLIFPSQPCTRLEFADQDAGAEPHGKLDVTLTPAILPGVVGDYDKRCGCNPNAGVIWIEDEQGALVKTLGFWGQGLSLDALFDYEMRFHRGCTVDVMSTPTQSFYTPVAYPWDGKGLHDRVVPDGNYKLVIDVQIDESHYMPNYEVPFTKGRTAFVLTPPPMPPQTGLTVTYTPD